MDGSTYVKSKMRHLKRETQRKIISNKNNRKSSKKYSNIFGNKSFLIDLWQLIFFSSISIILMFTYLDQAWKQIDTSQIEIKGLSGITRKNIEQVTSIFFPKNLLELNPKEIESYLLKNLPIQGISVSRKFFPPGIKLIFIEREPVAFASRISSNEIKNGMIDIEGYWIPLEYVNESKKNNIKLFVENWSASKKDDITLIIKNQFRLDSQLEKIKINSLQELIIGTEHFNSVLLGSNTERLIEQINKLNQLQKSLPNLLINTKVKAVDLKDPNKTELKIEKIQEE